MALVDIFTYNGESDILRLHLAVLGGVVDKFIICEARTTFTRRPKPLYFFKDQRYFKPWWHQIEYFVIDDDYSEEELAQAKSSPNTVGASHWTWEFLQKERMKKALQEAKLNDDDTVFIGDVDEIWNPKGFVFTPERATKQKLLVYQYYLNNRSDEAFWGTTVASWGYLKDKGLNHARSIESVKSPVESGWHFTSMGGLKEVQRKLNDSYTPDSYNMNVVPGHVEMCVKERKDFLNRAFTYTIDESQWPQYLTDNRKKYQHLLWQS